MPAAANHPNCIFCKIANGSAPSKKVYEDSVCVAFYDINPRAPIHLIVIPNEHIASLAALDDPITLGLLLQAVNKAAKASGAVAFRTLTNSGPQAFQTIPHLHFHVLGVRGNDSVMDLWNTRTSLATLPDSAVTT
jgi:histidine triad (HIT) family protein